MVLHKLKIWTLYFVDILNGRKTFDLRKDDRNFQLYDQLILQEFNQNTNSYTVPVTNLIL